MSQSRTRPIDAQSISAAHRRIVELHEKSARIRAQATAEIVAIDEEVAREREWLDAAYAAIESGSEALLPARRPTTLGGAMPSLTAARRTKGAYTDHSDHPLPRALGNVKAWAKKNKLPVSTVRSWYATDEKWGRPIPRPWANKFAKRYGIKIGEWPHGVTDDLRPRRKARKISAESAAPDAQKDTSDD